LPEICLPSRRWFIRVSRVTRDGRDREGCGREGGGRKREREREKERERERERERETVTQMGGDHS
jgi:hypothetical protein